MKSRPTPAPYADIINKAGINRITNRENQHEQKNLRWRRHRLRRNGQLSFGKHPEEELYHLTTDRACLQNLAADSLHIERLKRMRTKLFAQLREMQDPRVCGNGDIFDSYPFFQSNSFDFYERYMRGEITDYQTDWVNPTDYEPEPLD